MPKFPKGLFYDKSKKRWRARVRLKGVVVSTTYYKTLRLAEEGYERELTKAQIVPIMNPVTSMDLLNSLRIYCG